MNIKDNSQDRDTNQKRLYLQQFLQEQTPVLQAIITGYVLRMNLSTGDNMTTIAAEVFQEAVIELLNHADRFNPAMQPRAWFLAIAINVLKRHKVSYAKRAHFEVLIGGMAQTHDITTQELLEMLTSQSAAGTTPEHVLMDREGTEELLSLVSPNDARLLSLAFIDGWDANALAQAMGTTPGTARVRVHRALTRLRQAWQAAKQKKGER